MNQLTSDCEQTPAKVIWISLSQKQVDWINGQIADAATGPHPQDMEPDAVIRELIDRAIQVDYEWSCAQK